MLDIERCPDRHCGLTCAGLFAREHDEQVHCICDETRLESKLSGLLIWCLDSPRLYLHARCMMMLGRCSVEAESAAKATVFQHKASTSPKVLRAAFDKDPILGTWARHESVQEYSPYSWEIVKWYIII